MVEDEGIVEGFTVAVTVEDIAEAFPDQRPYRGEVTGTPPEIIGIREALAGRRWREVDAATCNLHHDAYNMLDVEPLAYFLPAFLTAAVTDRNGMAAEMLVYFVCMGHARELYRVLSPAQRDVLMGVVADRLERDSYFGQRERQQLTQRLREWRDA